MCYICNSYSIIAMKRKLLVLGLMAAVFVTLTACEKGKEIRLYCEVSSERIVGDAIFIFHADGTPVGMVKDGCRYDVVVHIHRIIYDSSGSWSIGDSLGPVKSKNITIAVEGDGFEGHYVIHEKAPHEVRGFKITVTENTGTEPRFGKMIITATKGNKTETFYRDLIQNPPTVE